MADSGAPLAALIPSWLLSLSERDLSPKTIEAYQRTGDQFCAWLAAEGLPDGTEAIEPAAIRAFLAHETERTSAVSAHQHFRNLRVLFRWLAREGERTGPDPMIRVDGPKVSRKVKPVLGDAELIPAAEGVRGPGLRGPAGHGDHPRRRRVGTGRHADRRVEDQGDDRAVRG